MNKQETDRMVEIYRRLLSGTHSQEDVKWVWEKVAELERRVTELTVDLQDEIADQNEQNLCIPLKK